MLYGFIFAIIYMELTISVTVYLPVNGRKEQIMIGAWTLENMVPCTLPQKVATGFTETLSNLEGASYIPVLYCGEQIVHGTNHMLICKQRLVTAQPEEHLVLVILNKPLPDDADQAWKILLIETIC